MKKKINFRFLAVVAVAIIITVTMSTIVFYELFKKEVMQDLKTYVRVLVTADIYDEFKTYDFNENLDELRVTIISQDGIVEFDTNVDIGGLDNHSGRPEVVEAFKTGEGQAIRESKTLEKNAFYYAVLLKNGSVLRVAKEAGSILSVFFSALPMIGVTSLLLFIICAVLSHFLTKSLVLPIEHLANNLDEGNTTIVYKELVPFITTIKKQHADIIRNASLRQEFTANVSHELKTPLTAISGYSELIENGMATEEDVTRFAAEIHRNSKRLLSLINDIIRLSELDHIEREVNYEKTNLYSIAGSCVQMLQMNAKKHHVTIEFHGELAYVTANKEMMEELIYNLCDNAIRYNNENGRVDVFVNPVSTNGANYVELVVKDTGIGISKENQERIFERFYRVDKSRSKSTGGTGLGLAIVKHIVARHENAHLELNSEVGKGTMIRVTFQEI
ncbi:MAG: ATP-binding protein [bacterium]|nr:ATP-binding protein [bacterium]